MLQVKGDGRGMLQLRAHTAASRPHHRVSLPSTHIRVTRRHLAILQLLSTHDATQDGWQ